MMSLQSFYASTALWIAAARARETGRSDRLLNDPYAEDLAGPMGFEILAASEKANGGVNPYIPVRTRYFDDSILRAAKSLSQAVLLGAGLDTRAFRLELPPAFTLFELDLSETFARKEAVLTARHASPRCRRVIVPADLAGTWADALAAAGFDAAAPCLWIAEGVFFYLSESAAESLLAQARELSAPGSMFLADILSRGVLKQAQLAPYLEYLTDHGAPVPFCSNDPASVFRSRGWEPVTITWPEAPEANYGRLPVIGKPPAEDTDRGFFILARC